MKILLVYPRTPATFWSFQHVLPFVAKRAAFPPLGLLTVAAMLPADWELQFVDHNIGSLADAQILWADYVFLSGMIVHREAAREVARRCASLGRAVVAGGPLFTTGHADFPEIPHFVCGEAEGVMEELVADLARGAPRAIYRSAAWPDVRATPVPRWDLVRVRLRQSISACSSSRARLRLPMKLSSVMNTMSRQPWRRSASSSRTICAGVLVRGTRPFMTTMSQNSQLNGQPRENCTGMAT